MKKLIILATVTAGHFALTVTALTLLLDLVARHAAVLWTLRGLDRALLPLPAAWLGSGIYLLALANSFLWASVLIAFLRWWRERQLVARPLAA